MSFDMTLPYSTGSSTYNTSFWILLSHCPDNVIVLSSSSPPDTDLGDQFIQCPAEKVLQVISNTKNKPEKGTRSIPAIH